ncbi:MAG: hypothetical protein AB8G77_00490 [Rhodothermales bacterium]
MPTIENTLRITVLIVICSLFSIISTHAITVNRAHESVGGIYEAAPHKVKRVSNKKTDTLFFDAGAFSQFGTHFFTASTPAITQQAVSSAILPDTLRALVIFAKFKDDQFKGDPNLNYRQWPLFASPNQLPDFAPHLLSTSLNPPFADSSLTDYFYKQSLGNFVLYGEVYDSVLVSNHPESRYHRSQGGYGALTKELLDKIDQYGFDFTEFDKNQDGYVDYIFVVLRGDSQRDAKRFVWTGASCLDARCSGSLAGGGPQSLPPYDGLKIDWNFSGSYIIHRTPGNIIPLVYHVRLMAHEIGHDLWEPHFIHIPSYQRNDVPASHNRGRGKDCISYMLMAGSGGAKDCQGSQTISAYERDLLGWINCTELTETKHNLTLGDLYTTSACYKIPLDEEPMGARLYLSNLQRAGYFDQLRKGGTNNQFDMGLLRTTGLLAVFAEQYKADVIPADNDLQLVIDNEAYEGDLFGPTTSTQLTPWTRPNSNGFNMYPRNHTHRWIAIDNIHYNESDTTAMQFDFHADFRENPIIREDSWMGSGLKDYVFDDKISVTNASVLTIHDDVTVAGDIFLDRQSKIKIADGATLTLSRTSTVQMLGGAEIEVAGTLILDALVQRSINTRIVKSGNGVIKSNLVD